MSEIINESYKVQHFGKSKVHKEEKCEEKKIKIIGFESEEKILEHLGNCISEYRLEDFGPILKG